MTTHSRDYAIRGSYYHPGATEMLDSINSGHPMLLVPKPHQKDPNAVEVYALKYPFTASEECCFVGYVAKEVAPSVRDLIGSAPSIDATFLLSKYGKPMVRVT